MKPSGYTRDEVMAAPVEHCDGVYWVRVDSDRLLRTVEEKVAAPANTNLAPDELAALCGRVLSRGLSDVDRRVALSDLLAALDVPLLVRLEVSTRLAGERWWPVEGVP